MASTQRVYHIDELKNNTTLKIDVKYYLSQQIHPVIMRLCSPLENIDAKMIAEYLGCDITVLNIHGKVELIKHFKQVLIQHNTKIKEQCQIM